MSVTDELEAPFSVRIGARLPDRDLCEGVPDWLLIPLLDWLEKELRAWSAKQLSIRLQHRPITPRPRGDHTRTLDQHGAAAQARKLN
jgi:hypothetical protein